MSGGSPLVERTIGELDVFGKTGAWLLAIIGEYRSFTTNPSADDHISPGDTLIVPGTPDQIENLERMIEG